MAYSTGYKNGFATLVKLGNKLGFTVTRTGTATTTNDARYQAVNKVTGRKLASFKLSGLQAQMINETGFGA